MRVGRERYATAPLLGLTLAVAALAGCGRDEPPLPRPGRIILVSMDTVRADRVSGYGGDTSPNLAAIAAEGVLFQRHYAASNYTIPSTMSMLTGRDVAEHGVIVDFARLSPELSTVAERLRAAGYRTFGFHEGGYVAARFGFDRGFDSYEERPRLALVGTALADVLQRMRAAGDAPYFLFLQTYAAHFPYGGFDRYRDQSPERGLPSERKLANLRRRFPHRYIDRKKPTSWRLTPELMTMCTLYNHFAEVHADRLGCGDNRFPDDFPESEHFAEDRAALLASYDDRIRRIDTALGRIRATLTELGQWDDTLLVVTSDHGEAFFEHGMQRHDYVPFDEALKVPMVVSFPALLRDGPVRTVDELTWHLDLAPTIIRLAGLEPDDGGRGLDLSAALAGRAPIARGDGLYPAVLRPAHKPQEPLRRVVVKHQLKLIEGHDRFGDAGGLLFDLGVDPGEKTNLRATLAREFDGLAGDVARYASGLVVTPPVHQESGRPIAAGEEMEPVALSEAELEQLRALGYLN